MIGGYACCGYAVTFCGDMQSIIRIGPVKEKSDCFFGDRVARDKCAKHGMMKRIRLGYSNRFGYH